MGVGFMGSVSSSMLTGSVPRAGNPDPNNYEVENIYELAGNLLIKLKYKNCSNYEGNKVLLFKGTTVIQLINQKVIDPHFSDDKTYKHPFARFEPTKAGWDAGVRMLHVLESDRANVGVR